MRDLAFLELDAVEQHGELATRQCYAVGVRTSERAEGAFLKSLIVQPEPVAVPLDQLHSVTTLVQEDEQIAVQRIE